VTGAVSAHYKIHKENLGYPVLSFLLPKERSLVAKASRVWKKSVQEFPLQLAKNFKNSVLHIAPDAFIVFKESYAFSRSVKADIHFEDQIERMLQIIAKLPTGEKLLRALTKDGKVITIAKGEETCSLFSIPCIVLNKDSWEKECVICEHPTGEWYFSVGHAAMVFVHELIHVYHSNQKFQMDNFLSGDLDIHFTSHDEQLTILGRARGINSEYCNAINENALRRELHLDPRVSHTDSIASLKRAALYGVDGEFTSWVKRQTFNTQEAYAYLDIAICSLIQGVVHKGIVFPAKRGNYLKIIRILIDAGCKKPRAFEILQTHILSSKSASRQVVDIVNKLSANPLHDALLAGWNQSACQCLIESFLSVEEGDGIVALLQAKNERGETPLQEARHFQKLLQTTLSQKVTITQKKNLQDKLIRIAHIVCYLALLEKKFLTSS
jgi:hypothetical protein